MRLKGRFDAILFITAVTLYSSVKLDARFLSRLPNEFDQKHDVTDDEQIYLDDLWYKDQIIAFTWQTLQITERNDSKELRKMQLAKETEIQRKNGVNYKKLAVICEAVQTEAMAMKTPEMSRHMLQDDPSVKRPYVIYRASVNPATRFPQTRLCILRSRNNKEKKIWLTASDDEHYYFVLIERQNGARVSDYFYCNPSKGGRKCQFDVDPPQPHFKVTMTSNAPYRKGRLSRSTKTTSYTGNDSSKRKAPKLVHSAGHTSSRMDKFPKKGPLEQLYENIPNTEARNRPGPKLRETSVTTSKATSKPTSRSSSKLSQLSSSKPSTENISTSGDYEDYRPSGSLVTPYIVEHSFEDSTVDQSIANTSPCPSSINKKSGYGRSSSEYDNGATTELTSKCSSTAGRGASSANTSSENQRWKPSEYDSEVATERTSEFNTTSGASSAKKSSEYRRSKSSQYENDSATERTNKSNTATGSSSKNERTKKSTSREDTSYGDLSGYHLREITPYFVENSVEYSTVEQLNRSNGTSSIGNTMATTSKSSRKSTSKQSSTNQNSESSRVSSQSSQQLTSESEPNETTRDYSRAASTAEVNSIRERTFGSRQLSSLRDSESFDILESATATQPSTTMYTSQTSVAPYSVALASSRGSNTRSKLQSSENVPRLKNSIKIRKGKLAGVKLEIRGAKSEKSISKPSKESSKSSCKDSTKHTGHRSTSKAINRKSRQTSSGYTRGLSSLRDSESYVVQESETAQASSSRPYRYEPSYAPLSKVAASSMASNEISSVEYAPAKSESVTARDSSYKPGAQIKRNKVATKLKRSETKSSSRAENSKPSKSYKSSSTRETRKSDGSGEIRSGSEYTSGNYEEECGNYPGGPRSVTPYIVNESAENSSVNQYYRSRASSCKSVAKQQSRSSGQQSSNQSSSQMVVVNEDTPDNTDESSRRRSISSQRGNSSQLTELRSDSKTDRTPSGMTPYFVEYSATYPSVDKMSGHSASVTSSVNDKRRSRATDNSDSKRYSGISGTGTSGLSSIRDSETYQILQSGTATQSSTKLSSQTSVVPYPAILASSMGSNKESSANSSRRTNIRKGKLAVVKPKMRDPKSEKSISKPSKGSSKSSHNVSKNKDSTNRARHRPSSKVLQNMKNTAFNDKQRNCSTEHRNSKGNSGISGMSSIGESESYEILQSGTATQSSTKYSTESSAVTYPLPPQASSMGSNTRQSKPPKPKAIKKFEAAKTVSRNNRGSVTSESNVRQTSSDEKSSRTSSDNNSVKYNSEMSSYSSASALEERENDAQYTPYVKYDSDQSEPTVQYRGNTSTSDNNRPKRRP